MLLEGAGHGWPGMAGTPLAAEINPAAIIWAFFRDQRSAVVS
jgi:poly(3-hydroxybutyrate) depolymerase